ncbi:glycosyltransferase [Kitasatospora sp. NPDC002040]|uniref:glycosyltransferase n=1 Tax=Kitasatospora sp. NPDC002040 TaxID=3154661 RepID=UPI00333370CD
MAGPAVAPAVAGAGTPDRGPAAGRRALASAPYLVLPVALLLWLLSLRSVDLAAMNDLGLLQVLPPAYWAAVALLTVGFSLALRDRRVRTGWLVAYLLGLIAMIHATPSLLYPTLRYSWAWKHLAVLDAMIRNNGPVPNAEGFDIYNQWPGFFVLNGLVLRVTGLHSALGYAAWAPLVTNLLLLAPLVLLYRAVSTDRLLVFGALWIYYSASWVGQDYFAPQAFAFLLFVTVLALVVRQLPDGLAPGGARPSAGADRIGRRSGRLPLILLLEAAIVVSHQLTPLMLICVLTALALPRRNRRAVLPALAGALAFTLAWDLTVARRFIDDNFGDFVRALTTPDGNIVSGLAGLGAAAPGQVVVAWVDRALSATVILLALAALWRRPWLRRTGLPAAALAPVPLLVANSYGGEMIFRVYLFALPSCAFLIAALLFRPGPRPRLRAVGSAGVLLALLGGLFFGYYSKEKMNYFTPGEVAAARQLVALAPPGSVVVSVTGNVPGGSAEYDLHQRIQLNQDSPETRQLLLTDPLAGLLRATAFAAPGTPAYLILNRGQANECFLTGALPADTVARLGTALDQAPRFTVVFRNDDAVIYRYVPRAT